MQYGNTPLLRAAQEGHAEVARFLPENGSDVQEQNSVSWPKEVLSFCLNVVSWSSLWPNDTEFLKPTEMV